LRRDEGDKGLIIFLWHVKNIAIIVQQKLSVIDKMYLSDDSGSIVYVGRWDHFDECRR